MRDGGAPPPAGAAARAVSLRRPRPRNTIIVARRRNGTFSPQPPPSEAAAKLAHSFQVRMDMHPTDMVAAAWACLDAPDAPNERPLPRQWLHRSTSPPPPASPCNANNVGVHADQPTEDVHVVCPDVRAPPAATLQQPPPVCISHSQLTLCKPAAPAPACSTSPKAAFSPPPAKKGRAKRFVSSIASKVNSAVRRRKYKVGYGPGRLRSGGGGAAPLDRRGRGNLSREVACWGRWKFRTQRLMQSPGMMMVMVGLTMLALVGPDIGLLCTDASADPMLEAASAFLFVVFGLEQPWALPATANLPLLARSALTGKRMWQKGGGCRLRAFTVQAGAGGELVDAAGLLQPRAILLISKSPAPLSLVVISIE